jgi:hypothetical protein
MASRTERDLSHCDNMGYETLGMKYIKNHLCEGIDCHAPSKTAYSAENGRLSATKTAGCVVVIRLRQ